jgi:hypothetical protein
MGELELEPASGSDPDPLAAGRVDALAGAHEAGRGTHPVQLGRALPDRVDHVAGAEHGVTGLGEPVGVHPVGAAHHEVGAQQPLGPGGEAGVVVHGRTVRRRAGRGLLGDREGAGAEAGGDYEGEDECTHGHHL